MTGADFLFTSQAKRNAGKPLADVISYLLLYQLL